MDVLCSLTSPCAIYCTLTSSVSFLEVFHCYYLYGKSRWMGIRCLLLYIALSTQTPNVHLCECSGPKFLLTFSGQDCKVLPGKES